MRDRPAPPQDSTPVVSVTPAPMAPPPSPLAEPGLDGAAAAEVTPPPAPREPEENKEAEASKDSEESKESEATAENGEASRRENGPRSGRASAKQTEENLRAAQQLLHAQRYEEARAAFGRLLGNRQSRGVAAAGLATIAFQEKKYREAVERARESARFGGGADARVLLGDAYFKLEKFDEAKKAYSEALKLDPNNRVAGQGLRLVEGRE
jgi:tetratricopeptide (TPR) repeat protein